MALAATCFLCATVTADPRGAGRWSPAPGNTLPVQPTHSVSPYCFVIYHFSPLLSRAACCPCMSCKNSRYVRNACAPKRRGRQKIESAASPGISVVCVRLLQAESRQRRGHGRLHEHAALLLFLFAPYDCSLPCLASLVLAEGYTVDTPRSSEKPRKEKAGFSG